MTARRPFYYLFPFRQKLLFILVTFWDYFLNTNLVMNGDGRWERPRTADTVVEGMGVDVQSRMETKEDEEILFRH